MTFFNVKKIYFLFFIYKNRYFFKNLLFFVALNFTLIVITFEGNWILMRFFVGITKFSIVYWMRYSAVCNSRASKFRRAFSYFFAFYIVKPLFFSENNYIFSIFFSFISIIFTLILITFEGKLIFKRFFAGLTQFFVLYRMRYFTVCNFLKFILI